MMVNKKCSRRVWSLRVTFSEDWDGRSDGKFQKCWYEIGRQQTEKQCSTNERFTYRLEFITIRTRTEISNRQMTIKTEMLW